MFLRSLLGVVLCELVASFFFLSALSNYYVSAAAVPQSFSDPGNTVAPAGEHTSWLPGVGSLGRPLTKMDFISSGTLLIRNLGISEVEGTPFTAATNLIARETVAGDPSLPTGTAGDMTATTSSIPVSPSSHFQTLSLRSPANRRPRPRSARLARPSDGRARLGLGRGGRGVGRRRFVRCFESAVNLFTQTSIQVISDAEESLACIRLPGPVLAVSGILTR
ncbi:hypothetical protein LXA43DRAFT_749713 [Ganoderma leucocontextum]|nr:hypothetical protein LXA43DRAFT_749713 [Ganoderma leucocontextum]